MYPDECIKTPTGLIIVSPTGEFFLSIGFLAFSVCTAVFFVMGAKYQTEKKVFFVVTSFITLISSFVYFAMLAGQGWVIAPNCRQIFYAHYVDFALGGALTLIDLGLIAGVSAEVLYGMIGFELCGVFCWWMASVSLGNVKWMWFIFAAAAMAPVFYNVFEKFRQSADLHHVSVSELYNKISHLTLTIWTIYPLVWLIGTASNLMSPNFELMCYTALDVVGKGVFGFILLMSHEAVERASSVYGADYGAGVSYGPGYGAGEASYGPKSVSPPVISSEFRAPKSSAVVMT